MLLVYFLLYGLSVVYIEFIYVLNLFYIIILLEICEIIFFYIYFIEGKLDVENFFLYII